jgi:hypothetical protein
VAVLLGDAPPPEAEPFAPSRFPGLVAAP